MLEKIKETVDFLKKKINFEPKVGVILGSGLGGLVESINNPVLVDYSDIPNFPVSTVEGHEGRLVFGQLGGKDVVAMQGRFHFYEGYPMTEVTFPVRVLKFLGIETLMVSNAAGGLNPDYNVGDIMLIKDHINMFGTNPLIGKNIEELGPRFPDMTKPYDHNLLDLARKIGVENNIKLREGVYVGSSGPTFETPAEYRLFRNIGADATGMSTVPEVIVARHMGLACFGVSVITNASEPEDPELLNDHEDVQDVAQTVQPKLTTLFTKLIEKF